MAKLQDIPRLGGRIHSVPFGQASVELGANWIHGANVANSVFNLACRQGLLSDELKYQTLAEYSYHFQDGTCLSQNEAIFYTELYDEIECGMYKVRSWDKTSVNTFFEEVFENTMLKWPNLIRWRCRQVFNFFRNQFAVHGGHSTDFLTVSGYGAFRDIPGGDLKMPGKMESLLTSLIESLPSENIHLNRSVDLIEWNCDPIRVTCSDSQVWLAKKVLVTIPLAVLKERKYLFQPNLPSDKREAIERVGFGSVAKIFLEYSEAFWKRGHFKGMKLCFPDDQYCAANRKELDENGEMSWIGNLARVEEVLGNPNVLCFWVAGNGVTALEESDVKKVSQQCTAVLRNFLGDPSIPVASDILVSRWTSNANFGGTYAYYTSDCVPNDFDILKQPIPIHEDPKVFFAGEATHSKYFGTMHAARNTGLEAAAEIMKTYLRD